METISEKELSALNDLLTEEELLIKKFQMLAQHSDDPQIKSKLRRSQTDIRNTLIPCMHS